ncbi:MAG TPA: hypothetical protein GXZ35_04175 [Acholeplasmataceae bacterium]|nr:hypothetical protein [Acholeplasmataceae bacterium]
MMIETKYECIPSVLFGNYLKFLIGRVFKILYMQEENNPYIEKYISGLLRELTGNYELIESIRYDGDFLTLLNKIQYLIYDYSDHDIVKKEIFECVSIIERLQKRYNFK